MDSPWLPINHRGDAKLALAFARLFWPDFVEVEGCVLLQHRADRTVVNDWLEKLDGDTQRVEGVLNHVHLWDELPGSSDDEEELMEVAQTIARTWGARLVQLFPGRGFVVEVVGPRDDYGPTVCMHRHKDPTPL